MKLLQPYPDSITQTMKAFTLPIRLLCYGITIQVCSAAPELFFAEDANPTGGPNDVPRPNSTPNSDIAAASFSTRLPGVAAEDFESFVSGAIPTTISFDATDATLSGGREILTVAGPTETFLGIFPISGENTLVLKAEQQNFFALDFSAPQAAFGFYGSDFGEPLGMRLTFVTTTGGRTTIDVPITIPQGSGGAFFIGIIDSENPFVRVEFQATGTEDDWFGFDDMRIATPEEVIPAPPVIGVKMYAGIDIVGTVGGEYLIEFSETLEPDSWAPLVTVVLPRSPYIHFDEDSVNHPKRFYRVSIAGDPMP